MNANTLQAKCCRSSWGLGLALVAALALCECGAEPPASCPPPPDVTFPVSISRMTSLPLPLGQFLGRTREQNETLLTPQSEQGLAGWVTYAPGFSIRYQGQQAVALKATLDVGAPWQEISAWAGFQPAAAPVCQGEVCRWEVGALCYGSLPLAATWNGATAELHVWQAQGSAAWRAWVGYGLLTVLLGGLLLAVLRQRLKPRL
ncbi:MAG: hypothetical protein JXA37_00380 [Chloroflexia bacterium]|nr:hypothetical protein [Chloroflexia bacterium]